MKIVNESYMVCSKCGIEAKEICNINEVFGYTVKNNDLIPYSECRKCRGEKQDEVSNCLNEKWKSAFSWGRAIHINRSAFERYLLELGYLQRCHKRTHGNKRILTEKGELHSRKVRLLGWTLLQWDFDTFVEVVKERAEKAVVRFMCPKCNAVLDTMSGFNHMAPTYWCENCKTESDSCYVDVVV